MLAINYKDEVLPIQLPACKKILRTWTVVDWCQNKPEGKKWTYTQLIKLVNKVAPVFTGTSCKDDAICLYPEDCLVTPVTLTATAEDDCTASSNIRYNWFVDIDNNGTNDVRGNSNSATVSLQNGLKYGKHMITWSAEDGCGNVKTCSKTFEVKDCKRPTPVAKLLSIELMPGLCMATLEASKVNNQSWDNCTPMANLRLRLAKAGQYSSTMTLAEVLALEDKVNFTGSEVGTQSIALFVIDGDNNFDYVETVIIVQSNLDPNCSTVTTANLTGAVKTEQGEDIESVKIMINSQNLKTTTSDGLFQVLLAKNKGYEVLPEKNINPMNGVSTADMVAINKHILGTKLLSSPYQYIAADVNKDKRVSTADMVEMRKMILLLQDGFKNNTSWRFVDKSYAFVTTDPLNEPFNERVNINNLTGDITANFVGVKIGDVNGTASPNSLTGGEERGVRELELTTEAIDLEQGEERTISFKASEMQQIEGYQFTMSYPTEKLEVLKMGGSLTEQNYAIWTERGAVTVSYDGKQEGEEELFTMTVRAKQAVQLSEVLKLNSSLTVAEAYHTGGEKYRIGLDYGGKALKQNELYQNRPNPFSGKTLIGFELEKSQKATLSIYDVNGRMLKTLEIDAVKGYNQVQLDKQELGASGVLHYRLTTDNFSATKQMIVTE